MPAEVTYENAQDLKVGVLSALGQGTSALIVDLAQTLFCDSSGLQELVHAKQLARALGVEYRLVLSPSSFLARSWSLRGFDQLFQTYSTLAAAMNLPSPAADGEVLNE